MVDALRRRLAWKLRRLPFLVPTENVAPEYHRGMRMLWSHTLLGSVGGAFYGEFVTLFLVALGASASIIGLRASFNSAVALAAPLVGAWLVERTGKRKFWVLLGPGLIGRVTLTLTALLPLLLHNQAVVYAFIALEAMQALINTISNPAASSLFGDIVPVLVRGRFLGVQAMVSNLASMITVPLAGWMIGRIGGVPGYQMAWIVAALIGAWSFIYYARIPEPDTVERQHEGTGGWANLVEGWRLVLRDKRFMAYCGIIAVWNFSVGQASPFFSLHMVENLGFQVETISLIVTVSAVVNMLAMRFAGEFVDRYGAARVTAITYFFVPLMPVAWMFAQTPLQVIMARSLGFLAWAGSQVGATPLILLMVPTGHRSRYIAIYNTILGFVAIFTPIPASYIYSHLGFHTNLVVSASGRMLGAVLFFLFYRAFRLRELQEPTARPAAPLAR